MGLYCIAPPEIITYFTVFRIDCAGIHRGNSDNAAAKIFSREKKVERHDNRDRDCEYLLRNTMEFSYGFLLG